MAKSIGFSAPVRAAYLAGGIEALCAGETPHQRREQALVRMATMVGALLLARATSGDALSGEILAAARAVLSPTSVRPVRVMRPRVPRSIRPA